MDHTLQKPLGQGVLTALPALSNGGECTPPKPLCKARRRFSFALPGSCVPSLRLAWRNRVISDFLQNSFPSISEAIFGELRAQGPLTLAHRLDPVLQHNDPWGSAAVAKPCRPALPPLIFAEAHTSQLFPPPQYQGTEPLG